MATRRRSRRKTISGNLTDIQKRIRYLETRPAAGRLASKAVSTRNLALRAVEEDVVADNAIVRRSIANNAVGTAEIEQDSITNSLIATNAVNTDSIAPDAVTADEIAPGAVGNGEIADDAVNNAKIATDAVNSDSIQAGAVGNTELAGGIADSKIAGMSSSKLQGDVEDSQINTLSASKVSGVLDETNIPDLATSKIISGVLDIDTIPEITADRMPSLDASKFTTGIFDEALIPNLSATRITTGTFTEDLIPDLDAAKFTSDTFAVARIPNLSALKITSGTFSLDRIPVFPESEIATDAVGSDELDAGAVTDAKISSLRSVRGSIVDDGLSVVYPMTKSIVSGIAPSSGLVGIGLVNNSAGFNVAEGDHTHGQNGYSAISSTGVASHTHPVSIAQSGRPNPLDGTGTHGGHTSPGSNDGSHQHQTPGFDGTATSNTSTLKLKKDISEYKVPEIKKLLNLQLKKYKYKNQVRYLQESINRDWMYGYIAEEVEELGFEELVGYDEKGEPASLNYGLLSTLVLELVKVQQTEISLIKEKIKRRRQKYDKLSS
jgi:hypothetical protein